MLLVETNRLLIREFKEEDYQGIHEMTKIPDLTEYEPWGPHNLDDAKNYVQSKIKSSLRNPRLLFSFVIEEKLGSKIIGVVEVRKEIGNNVRGHLGYFIHPEYWNQGIATESSQLVMNFLTKKKLVSQFFANCDVLNIGSQCVLKKLGFKEINKRFGHMEMKGRIRDSIFYALFP